MTPPERLAFVMTCSARVSGEVGQVIWPEDTARLLLEDLLTMPIEVLESGRLGTFRQEYHVT